jgi:hypothetical protein
MKRRIAGSLSLLLWAIFTYIGYGLVSGVAQRHVTGYPNAGQWRYYVYFPMVMALVSAGLLLLQNKLPTGTFLGVWILQLLIFLPFFLGYTGGV